MIRFYDLLVENKARTEVLALCNANFYATFQKH